MMYTVQNTLYRVFSNAKQLYENDSREMGSCQLIVAFKVVFGGFKRHRADFKFAFRHFSGVIPELLCNDLSPSSGHDVNFAYAVMTNCYMWPQNGNNNEWKGKLVLFNAYKEEGFTGITNEWN